MTSLSRPTFLQGAVLGLAAALAAYALYYNLAITPVTAGDLVGWFIMYGVPTLLEAVALVALHKFPKAVGPLATVTSIYWGLVLVATFINPVFLAFADSPAIRLLVAA